MKQTKISIIGAGTVGSTIAYAILMKNLSAQVQLIDIDKKQCRGEILDLSDALAFCGPSIITSGSIKDVVNSDIIIIAAGQRQKTGQDRIALFDKNKEIVNSIMSELKNIKQSAIIIMVTNPLDLLVTVAQKQISLSKSQIFGAGTFLDTQRLLGILANKLSIARESIHAYVLGEHGETQFVAWSTAHTAGIPLTQLIDAKQRKTIVQETKNKASEIISCKGATYWGIATCTAAICHSIIFDQKRIMPLSVYLNTFDVYLSMPAVLGANGVEKIMPIPLNKEETEKLAHSAQIIKSIINTTQ